MANIYFTQCVLGTELSTIIWESEAWKALKTCQGTSLVVQW